LGLGYFGEGESKNAGPNMEKAARKIEYRLK
jgi:hypothetical protein